MAKKTSPLLPWTDDLLKKFGDRLRLARLRRKLTAKQVAERSGMSAITLRNVENGKSGVTIGAYIAVMQVLGIEKDFDLIAQKDELGRNLQDASLTQKKLRLPAPKLIKAMQPIKVSFKSSESSKTTTSGTPESEEFIETSYLASLIKDKNER